MKIIVRKWMICVAAGTALLPAGCGGGNAGNQGGGSGSEIPTTPLVTVAPASTSITAADSLQVTVSVSGASFTPTGSVIVTSGTYTSQAVALNSGNATITIPAKTLAAGTNRLDASYTPDSSSSSKYKSATGSASVTITLITPTVTVSPASTSISTTQSLSVTVTVNGRSGDARPTGSVTVSSGSYASAATQLSDGSATIVIGAGALATGANTLNASYTPDNTSSKTYAANTGSASVAVTGLMTPTVAVNPASTSLSTAQPLNVTMKVSGSGSTPTGSVTLTGGTYTSAGVTLTSGSASIVIPPYSLSNGSNTLTAAYTPDAQSTATYGSSGGSAIVSVAKATPTVTLSPVSSTINETQTLDVTVSVSGGAGARVADGTVTLTRGGYTSPSPVPLSGGSKTITIPAGAFAPGSDALTATYAPDPASSAFFNPKTSDPVLVTVIMMSTISVNQSTPIGSVTDQLMGMNLAAWYNVVGNATPINTAFAKTGIKAIRWPGGSWSDAWHWRTSTTNLLPYMCPTDPKNPSTWGGYTSFADFVTSIAKAGSYDLALTANYGSNAECNGGGDPAEAASWATEALTEGYPASHITVGNENYGSWEFDLHAAKNDPTTYANSVIGSNGFYKLIKAASPMTRVGVVVDAGGIQKNWDSTVLGVAKGSYDIVEFHYYARNPGQEDDSYLVHTAAQDLTKNLKTLQSELTTAGVDVPIYVGEMGSVSSNPGKQSWSIAQGLYAGQALGEMMNAGVKRATWWIGFGNCNGQSGSLSSSLYGWQNFGAYNVFSNGPGDTGPDGKPCAGAGSIGTMSPTAQALNLFQNIAVNGENALSATVSGDQTNIRAYAATHSGGTALFLFNLNQSQSQPVTVTFSKQSASSDVTVITYDKQIYDYTDPSCKTDPACSYDPAHDYTNLVWASPSTKDMGQQNLPLTLSLTPWSMNVVIIK